MKIQSFNIDSKHCTISADVSINADKPDYSLFMGSSFDLKGTYNISITNNNPGLPFTVFKGDLKNKYLDTKTRVY